MKLFKLLSFALLLPTLTAVAQTTQVYSYTVPDPTPTAGYAPNGNILSYTDSVTGTWNMTYDSLNRLTSAGEPGSTGKYAGIGLSMTYDSFGNRLSQTATGPFTTLPSHSATYDAGNHILTSNGVPFPAPDAGGNLPSDGHNSFLYDGENRICASRNGTTGAVTLYLYDAEGRRVGKGHNATNAWQCSMGGADFLPDATYVLGQGGEQITESDGQGNWVHSNVYAGGQLLATYDNNGTGLHFHITDPLGSRRVQVSSTGNVEQTCGNLPFGDYANNTNTPDCSGAGIDATEHHFTGKERDTESGLDYFGARYYGSNMGRFMSPDWAVKAEPVPYAKLDNPQSLNLYAYVGNNPLSKRDLDGHCAYSPGGPVCLNGANGMPLCICGPPPKLPNGKPAPPNVPVPGGNGTGWKWNADTGNGRGGTWGPEQWDRRTQGNPPRASWDDNPGPNGVDHWDVKHGPNGPQQTDRYGEDGKPLTPDEAHGRKGPKPSPMVDAAMDTLIKVTVWGMVQAIRFDQWLNTPCGCSTQNGSGPANVPNPSPSPQ